MVTEICLPKIKKTVTRASIGRWFKRVGDPVSVDEPLVEIETDNKTIEVAASATGVLSEISRERRRNRHDRNCARKDYGVWC